MKSPKPTEIKLHIRSRILEVTFSDGNTFNLLAEYLRVYSPSAEVQGHGVGQDILQTGKESVNIEAIEPVGNYAIQIRFDDGHDTGIYSWDTLYQLGKNQDLNWQNYLERLNSAGYERIQRDNNHNSSF